MELLDCVKKRGVYEVYVFFVHEFNGGILKQLEFVPFCIIILRIIRLYLNISVWKGLKRKNKLCIKQISAPPPPPHLFQPLR